MFVTCELFFIPISIILLLLFKYSDNTAGYIREYSNYPSSLQLNNGLKGRMIAGIFLVLHLALTLAYKGFHFEIRHSKAKNTFKAMSMPDVDIKTVLITFFHCVCFISIQQSYNLYYPYVNLFTYGYCAWSYVYYLPFYIDFMNFVKAFLYFDCFCITLFFMTASYFNDAAIAQLLSIVFQPIIFIIVKNSIQFRKFKIKATDCYLTSDLSLFELSARESLKIDANPSLLLKQMYDNYFIKQNKLIFVYQANYCADVLNNSHLALVKASQAHYEGFSIFTNFQVYKCQKNLEKFNMKNSPGIRMFLYLRDLNNLLKEDKSLCKFLLIFFNQILTNSSNNANINNSVKVSGNLIKKIKTNYEYCLKKYPNSEIINEMYGSMLSKVLFDQEKGVNHLLRSATCSKTLTGNKETNIFLKKKLYYMVISGNKGQTGKILSASSNLKTLLGISFDEERSYFLHEFIPKPYNFNHDLNLSRFIYNALDTQIVSSFPLFIGNSEGYLIECVIHTESVGFESSVMFIVIFDILQNLNREAAIIGQN